MKSRLYRLTSGRYVTAREVMDVTGLSKPGAYKRLAMNRDDKDVFAEVGLHIGRKGIKIDWVSEPVRVVMGIPINPEYLDGQIKGCVSYDRDDNKLTYTQRAALARYRRKLRKEWRDTCDTIKNRSSYNDSC
jgi:hypothetical protein